MILNMLTQMPVHSAWFRNPFAIEYSKDASHWPASQEYIGKKIRLKQAVLFIKLSGYSDEYSIEPCGTGLGFKPSSIEKYYEDLRTGQLDRNVLGVIEEKTEILVTRVEFHEHIKSGTKALRPYGRALSGEFEGDEGSLSTMLNCCLNLEDELKLVDRFAELVEE